MNEVNVMTLQDELTSPEFMKLFQRERLETELTEMICRIMKEQNVSRAELARRLGTSRSYVTKVLRDGSNMTLKSVSDIFFALNRSLRLIDRPVSMWTPELLVMEVPHFATQEVPAEDIQYQGNDIAFKPVADSSSDYTTADVNPVGPQAA